MSSTLISLIVVEAGFLTACLMVTVSGIRMNY